MSVLYTPLAPEVVLAGMDQEIVPYQELSVGGVKMLVEQAGPNQCRVVRLLSTNPQDYLRAEFQPGTMMNFVPEMN